MTAPTREAPGRSRGSTVAKIGLSVVVVLLVVMWVYAFAFAPREPIYAIEDREWLDRAAAICDEGDARRTELTDVSEGYIADPTPEQAARRADIVEQATDIMEDEVDQIVAVQPASEEDRRTVAEWEGFYRTLIEDRRAYVGRLRAYDLTPYSETLLEGGPVTNVLVDFANVNRIEACAPPSELGSGG